jgi:hypothetical protein
MAVSFLCGGNWSTQRKPQTCCKSLTNTDCCKSNYHTIAQVVVNPTTIWSRPRQPPQFSVNGPFCHISSISLFIQQCRLVTKVLNWSILSHNKLCVERLNRSIRRKMSQYEKLTHQDGVSDWLIECCLMLNDFFPQLYQ